MNFSHARLTSTLFGTNYGEKVVLELLWGFFVNIYEVSGLATLDQDCIVFKLFLQMVGS